MKRQHNHELDTSDYENNPDEHLLDGECFHNRIAWYVSRISYLIYG